MARQGWKEPKNKTVWLSDLIDAGESVVKGYERYLLDQMSSMELAKIMSQLRSLLPMDIEDKFDK
jgi:hypothetical protein